ncbi:MAG: 3-deoxy-manno-octulosonate cytidylyltransferase [Pseudomonadota bacterium]
MADPFAVVIPARYASTRLPGKPLEPVGDAPMVVQVARRAERAGAREVVVATDDSRIRDAVTAAGLEARMTRPDHPSGSDRVMEVAEALGWSEDTVVVNVQGDEPLIPPAVIGQVAALVAADPGVPVATLCEPVDDLAEVLDPNVVKVVAAADGTALYFSRAPIPYARDAFTGMTERARGPLPEPAGWHRHIGIYAYRVAALRRFVAAPVGALERLESLEQLRLLEMGVRIRVAVAEAPVPAGVDTPADLRRVRERLANG